MRNAQQLLADLSAGRWDAAFASLYGCAGRSAADCYARLVEGFTAAFGDGEREFAFYSAPGRTELGGNHTDHQHGRVLAASVDLDVIALAAPNGTNTVRVLSEGFRMDVVDLARLTPVEEETNHSASLIRGVCAAFAAKGWPVQGFDAYTTSAVLKGSGLSSSAAFEVLIGNIANHLFAGGAETPVTIAQIGQYAENVFFGKPSGLLDQMASSVGGVVAMDFADPAAPVVQPLSLDLAGQGYALCIVDTGADHADLTGEYAAIPAEMKAVAAALGGQVLRDVPKEAFYKALPALRKELGDRALLRAFHFYADDERAAAVYRSIGVYLGHTMGLYAQFYDIHHVQMMGRVMSGKGGDIILAEAARVMDEEYPDVAFRPEAPDEMTRRVGQSSAAASLPEVK